MASLPSPPSRSKLILLPLLLTISIASALSKAPGPSPSPTPSPAPAPAPFFVNITQVLVAAGDFSTFTKLLISTGVMEKFQSQANETDVGITIFAPKDKGFKAEPAATLLKNLTTQQLMSLLEYHALNKWESLAVLQQSSDNVTSTFASFNGGGRYVFNVSEVVGQVEVITDWNKATIASTLYNAQPCSIFAIEQVLLPEDLFGLPAPAPAPSPSSGALSPGPSSSSSSTSSSATGPAGGGSNSAAHSSVPSLFIVFLVTPLFFKLLL